jgi:hypothetical protein
MEKCIELFKTNYSNFNLRSLLINGNIEKQLKFLLLNGHHDKDDLWYVMDKRIKFSSDKVGRVPPEITNLTKSKKFPKSQHEIDVIALEGTTIKFVAEAKCTFACDTRDEIIHDAIKKAKITQYLSTNQEELPWLQIKAAAHYIIHFLLLSDPRRLAKGGQDKKQLKWLYDKYPHRDDYTVERGKGMADGIKNRYMEKLGSDVEINKYNIMEGDLDLILVKLP